VREGFRPIRRLRRARRDLDDELAFHFDETVRALVSRGWAETAAREEARRRFGDERRWRREMQRIGRAMEMRRRAAAGLAALSGNVRYAVRGLRRSPGFTLTVVFTFALGIGANATMFGILDRILLRAPAHVVEPDAVRRLVVDRLHPARGERTNFAILTYPDYRDLSRAGSFRAAAFSPRDITVGWGVEAERVAGVLATGSLFPVLGVQPAVGRFFTEAEDRLGGPQVVVLGHEYWRTRFGGDPGVVGRSIDFGHGPWEVIGVAPAGFTGADLRRVDLWLPVHQTQEAATRGTYWYEETGRGWTWLRVVGRLGADMAPAAAEAEATLLHRQGRSATVEAGHYDPEARVVATPLILARGPDAPASATVARWLGGVSLLVVLIACANVANLLLARAVRRRREVGIRLALGVSRRSLAMLLVTEGVVLALAGGAAALVFTYWTGDFMRNLLMEGVHWAGAAVGARVLVFVALLSLLAGALASLLPAWQVSRARVVDALASDSRTVAGGSRAQSALTVAQAAFSVVLLVGAGLFVRSFDRVRSLDLGFEPQRVAVAWPVFDAVPQAERDAFFAAAAERLRALPEVEAAAAGIGLPFWSGYAYQLLVPGVDSIPTLATGSPAFHAVEPDWIPAMGMRVVRGRSIQPTDVQGAPRVALVNETMARVLWPGIDALGQCMHIADMTGPCFEVVGVMRDARHSNVIEGESMQYFVPLAQRPIEDEPEVVVVRTRGEPTAALPVLRREMAELDGRVRYVDARPYREFIDPQYRSWRLGALLFTSFGALALLVAAVGLYGLLAFGVAQRTREIGIRAALGARRERIVRLVVSRSLRLVAGGLLLGLAIAALAAPRLQELLYETAARDAAVFAGVALTLLVVAVLGAVVPAWRAVRIQPQEALRVE
jgi:predicted permease